jgi:hypothetical protein
MLVDSPQTRPPRRRPTQHLYRLPSQWADYDPKKKQFVRTPPLPDSALPVRTEPKPAPAPAPAAQARKQPPGAPAAATPAAKAAAHALPANGAELQRRLSDYDARLAAQGLCQPGALVKHVVQAGVEKGYDPDLSTWSGPAIALAVDETKAFEARLRPPAAERKEVA